MPLFAASVIGVALMGPAVMPHADNADAAYPHPTPEQPTGMRPEPYERPKQPVAGVDVRYPDARCGDILFFDLGSMLDRNAYYTNPVGVIISNCGGCGMMPRAEMERMGISCGPCPPEGWTCPTPPARSEPNPKQMEYFRSIPPQ